MRSASPSPITRWRKITSPCSCCRTTIRQAPWVGLAVGAGVFVRSARSSASEQTFEWGVVRQLFGGGVDDVLGSDERFAVLRGLCEIATDLAQDAPYVICVDDVQWCDEASLQLLAYLVRRLEGLPLLLVLAMRSGEPHQAVVDALEELVANLLAAALPGDQEVGQVFGGGAAARRGPHPGALDVHWHVANAEVSWTARNTSPWSLW